MSLYRIEFIDHDVSSTIPVSFEFECHSHSDLIACAKAALFDAVYTYEDWDRLDGNYTIFRLLPDNSWQGVLL